MNKRFNALSDAEKISFLEVMAEEDIGFYFSFKEEVIKFISQKYPNFREPEWVFKKSSDGLQLCAYPTVVYPKAETFACKILKYQGGDSDFNNDDEFVLWKNEKYPKGIEFEIPIHFLVGITFSRTPLTK